MSSHYIGLDDFASEMLETAKSHGFDRDEFVQACIKMGAAVCEVEGEETLPDPDATPEEMREWCHDHYPDKLLPETE